MVGGVRDSWSDFAGGVDALAQLVAPFIPIDPGQLADDLGTLLDQLAEAEAAGFIFAENDTHMIDVSDLPTVRVRR